MGKKLYVGNLGYDVKDSDLSQLFAAHGKVGTPRSSWTGSRAAARASASWKCPVIPKRRPPLPRSTAATTPVAP